MNFNFTEEQQLLADTVRRFVREHYSFEHRREILTSPQGWSREAWNELAALGLTALNVPEEHGGLGAGAVDTMLVMNALPSAATWRCKGISGLVPGHRRGRTHRSRRSPGAAHAR
jgi:alkylation response protein AidB-like acyl-CoA dehydrogenase